MKATDQRNIEAALVGTSFVKITPTEFPGQWDGVLANGTTLRFFTPKITGQASAVKVGELGISLSLYREAKQERDRGRWGAIVEDQSIGCVFVVRSDNAPLYSDGNFSGYWSPGVVVVEYANGEEYMEEDDNAHIMSLTDFLADPCMRKLDPELFEQIKSEAERLSKWADKKNTEPFEYTASDPWWED